MQASIIDANAQNIQQLVETSATQPVVLNFHSAQAPECQPITQKLMAMASERAGQFVLANVDCDTQMELAGYFRIQALPTVLVLNQGQTVDGFAGPQPEAMVEQLLEKYLPKLWQLKLNNAKELLDQGETSEAVSLLREALQLQQDASVYKALAKAYLAMKRSDDAEEALGYIKLEDQDGEYASLMAELELAQQAADTPEIRDLQTAIKSQPNNTKLVVELAVALNQAGRQQEALEALFALLRSDLTAADGEARRVFLDIVNALGQTDPTANNFRRKLYSLLY